MLETVIGATREGSNAWRGPVTSRLKRTIKFALYHLATVKNLRGTHPKTCTVCGYHGRFRAYGHPPRYDAECSQCTSLERHRLLALLLQQRPDLVSGNVVHFAPEKQVQKLLKTLTPDYRSADLMMGGVDLKLNIEAMNLPDASVDAFIASHVLEHVDDRKALSEFHRVLKLGGRAIIMVPIIEGWEASYENPSVSTDEDRHLHFGQADHVRYYGRDLRDRIAEAGFRLSEFVGSGEDVVEYGLTRGERVFIAEKA